MEQSKVTYNEATAQIEAIIRRFRSNDISVDELSTEVKRATELITICRKRLTSAEEELAKILEQ